MPEHVPLVDRVPERMRDRPTWLISRAYARANGLLQEGFAQGGGGLRGYHYRLLAALDEWGPASQAALGRGTGIDRSDSARQRPWYHRCRLTGRPSIRPQARQKAAVGL